MPSASPSPIKRPSLNERTSSAHSLSSSGRHTTTTHKVQRPHTVTRHSRNVSHGKGLGKLNKVHSTANITTDSQKNHQRKKSGGTTPPHSPRAPLVKRNSSHVALAKNPSFGNLRKNHSATVLPRNVSHGALKKLGLTAAPKKKEAKDGVFQLGDKSSGEDEEEGEWEDSATQSPEMTRNNSKTGTPVRSHTPNESQIRNQSSTHDVAPPERTSSPPLPSLKNFRRSAPDLKKEVPTTPTPTQPLQDPTLLQQRSRSSRAPPAMTTVSAHVGPAQLIRNSSTRSFTHVSQADAAPYSGQSSDKLARPSSRQSGQVGVSTSVEGGVSHFLSGNTPQGSFRQVEDDSDEDSPSNFLSHYKPQPSESPEKTKTLHQVRAQHMQSRTQQKLELQRREQLRGSTTATVPPNGTGVPFGSMSTLHSRTASRNRNRTADGDSKAAKQVYDTTVKQLLVVRRFRSPLLESLNRLKDTDKIPREVGATAAVNANSRSRPPSRRGLNANNGGGYARSGPSQSFEEPRSSPLADRGSARDRAVRFTPTRRSSRDDIEVTPSLGSPEEQPDEGHPGVSAEQALMRRIWESREVFDPGEG